MDIENSRVEDAVREKPRNRKIKEINNMEHQKQR